MSNTIDNKSVANRHTYSGATVISSATAELNKNTQNETDVYEINR